MSEKRVSLHGQWSSRLAFILAVAGSAVGLGNIWRFPYMAGENGGGAFVLVYLACVFVIGLPIMMAEILIGRRGRRNPVATMKLLGAEETGTTAWRGVGLLGVATGFLILSFYSVIAGWAMAYIVKGGSGVFTGAGNADIGSLFDGLMTNPVETGVWHTVFMALTIFVVALGVEKGLERAVRVLMPGLVGLLLILLAYSATTGNLMAGARFLFTPDFGELSREAFLEALGQAFFTLSVGMGAIMAYGAYLPNEESIGKTAIAVALADTAIAILAALLIFTITITYQIEEAQGPGLVFVSLPLVFGQMPGGVFVAVIFFTLLTFAAWTSAISLMEPAVTFFMEQLGFVRRTAALLVGGIIWMLGWLTVLSFGPWAEKKYLGSAFDYIDFATNNVMLPLGGFAIVVFAGWFMARNSTADEIDPDAGLFYKLWRLSARYLAPLAILMVLLHATGALTWLQGLFAE